MTKIENASKSEANGKLDNTEVEVESEADKRLRRVFEGNLTELPSLSSKIVRIFTSSTFTDTTLERNALMATVYPKLKEYCRERHGLEFQVVDMRWGVRDEATDDHMTTELCMKEIDNCQRLSMGPNFVVFLGQKYGYRPIPTIIVASEFELLYKALESSPEEQELMSKWYKKDENTVPPVYILQPISSILANFNNKRHQRLMEADQNIWWETLARLQHIIRKSVKVCFIARKMDKEQVHNYFMSVTEREVRRGVLNAPDVKEHCLAYIREIKSINLQAVRFCRNFVDMLGMHVDTEAQELLGILRDKHLSEKLPESNLARFEITWTGKEGLDADSHAQYIETFCEHFNDSIVELIDRAVEANKKLSSDSVYTDVLQHLHACHNFCKIFQGREEVVEKIKGYICGSSREPLILWGQSGCGKTSLLAKAYSQVSTWLPKKTPPVMVLRFLGTSPDSSTIMPMLTSVCQQVCRCYDQPDDEIPDELSPLIQYFKKLISCATKARPLVLFLDSLDQLSGADGAHQLAWLPISLPDNVRVVVSTLPNYYNILDTLRKMVYTEDNYVQVTPLGQNLGSIILGSWLKNSNRTVTEHQWGFVQKAIESCNLPLFVKLVFDEISRWRSYNKVDSTSLAGSIHDSIMKLFDRIESQHGKILVSHALGLLTAAKSGLSEAELEDLLSLDEKVLNDVYQYHLPPVRRIPPLLWTRIRNDLPHYFSEREADGVNVIDWYHRQFIEAARERYFKNLNFVNEMHTLLADYFLGLWGGKPKPFVYSDLQRQRFALSETAGESDRKVPEQPLCFKDSSGRVTRYNLRKLSEMPYHLIRSARLEDLYKNVLFNYQWLHAKLSCMPLQTIIADFEDALEYCHDRDVKLLMDALRLSASVLTRHPQMLGPQIAGRMLPYYNSHEKIQQLIKLCDSDGLEVNALVPSYHCLHTPGGPLKYSLEGHERAPFGIGITSDTRYLVSVSNIYIIWDLKSGDVFRQVNPGIQGLMQNLLITPNDKFAISYTNNDQIVICNIMTGDVKILNNCVDGVESISGTTVTNTHIMIWSAEKWYLYNIEGEFLLKGDEKLMNLSIIYVQVETEPRPTTSDERMEGNGEGEEKGDTKQETNLVNGENGGEEEAQKQESTMVNGDSEEKNDENVTVNGEKKEDEKDSKTALVNGGSEGDKIPVESKQNEESKPKEAHTANGDIKQVKEAPTANGDIKQPQKSKQGGNNKAPLIKTDSKLPLTGIPLLPEEMPRLVVWKTEKPIPGVETEEDMTLEIQNDDIEQFYFHSAIAISRDKNIVYGCIAISDDAIACYKRDGNTWKYDRTLGNNYDKVFTLTFSPNENYLVATVALGYKLWDLNDDKLQQLKLPPGVRNIPNKNPLITGIVFTKNTEFVVAGVRQNLYVWETKGGNLVKTLDAHFGRILSLQSISNDKTNIVVSSSIDKSIKIWNFDHILEDAHAIDRHEKSIDGLSLASNAYIGCTTTRNCVGVWNLENGSLTKTLANSAHSSIVTHSVITSDGQYVVSAESGNVLFWDVDKAKVLKLDPQRDVMQMMLTDDDTKVITVSKGVINKGKVVCRAVPSGDTVYQFDYNLKSFKTAVVTADGLFLIVVACSSKNKENEVLGMYHAKTGTHMYDMALKYNNFKPFTKIVAMPNEPTQVALIDDEKGNIFDVKKKSLVRAVQKWNGVCTQSGRYGLYAPNRGGLELLDLKTGKVHHTLIPRVAEGVFSTKTLFTKNDQHVIYYHSGHKSIRVFRVVDGKQIADYKAHAELKAIESTQGGTSIVLGAVDGGMVVLTVADPKNKHNKEFLTSLPSRQLAFTKSPEESPSRTSKAKFQAAMNVARVIGKAKVAQKSRACIIQ